MMSENNEKLNVLWTSADRDVALKMVFMYARNAKLKGWWKEVTLIVWGPSAKLLSQDSELQQALKVLIDAGVEVLACKACSDSYGVSAQLEALNIEVKYMGEPLTGYLKNNEKVITF